MGRRHRRHGDEADDRKLAAANGTCNHRYAGLRTALIDEYNVTFVNGANYLPSPAEYHHDGGDGRHPARREKCIVVPIELSHPMKRPMTSSMHCPSPSRPWKVPYRHRYPRRTLPHLLDKPLFDPVFTADDGALHAQESDPSDKLWKVQTKDWSIECPNWKDNYGINNQAIISMVATKEIYIRFGDTSIPLQQPSW